MTVQKIITYVPLDLNGKQGDAEYRLPLNVLKKSGND